MIARDEELDIFNRLAAPEIAWFLERGYERELPRNMKDRRARIREALIMQRHADDRQPREGRAEDVPDVAALIEGYPRLVEAAA